MKFCAASCVLLALFMLIHDVSSCEYD